MISPSADLRTIDRWLTLGRDDWRNAMIQAEALLLIARHTDISLRYYRHCSMYQAYFCHIVTR